MCFEPKILYIQLNARDMPSSIQQEGHSHGINYAFLYKAFKFSHQDGNDSSEDKGDQSEVALCCDGDLLFFIFSAEMHLELFSASLTS